MGSVKEPEQRAVMHELVRPVKISVLDAHRDRETEDEIYPAVVGHICIEEAMRFSAGEDDDERHQRKYEDAGRRIKRLARNWLRPIGLARRRTLLPARRRSQDSSVSSSRQIIEPA